MTHRPTDERHARERWLRGHYESSWRLALQGCATSIALWHHCCARLIEHAWAGWGVPTALTQGDERYLLKGGWLIDCHGRHDHGWLAVRIDAPDGTVIHPAMLEGWVMPRMTSDRLPLSA